MDIFTEERQKKIVEIVNKRERISVPELSEMFNVSEVTIRRDLKTLSDKKEITRTHGGAIKKPTPAHIIWGAGSRSILFKNRESKFEEQLKTDVVIQKKIAEFAANFITNEDNIIIESTNINVYLAQAISNKLHLNIFTNSPVISTLLAKPDSNSNVYCSGGLLKKDTDSFIGPRAIDFFKNLNADKVFISIGAISPAMKITMSSIEGAE
ncbi:MAG: DeoR/GlpR family DNA-binding transcription regulator, partial [Actinobacteria bacterium]|nr:DeoR/GlpR family DNA-binding transcription regulator [Actinomycetota bacterium]